jgi:transcriptional regulator with XRE-family HTH domain
MSGMPLDSFIWSLHAEFSFDCRGRAVFRVSDTVFNKLGEQLRAARAARGLSQPALAARIGRDRARISELERDLAGNRWGRDRLTLFAEICEALDLVPVLVPRRESAAIRRLLHGADADIASGRPVTSAFDDLFVDLSDQADPAG